MRRIPLRGMKTDHTSHNGNSCIASPWGDFIAHADEKESIVYGDIDLDYEDSVREQLPLLKHRRPELYWEELGMKKIMGM